MADDELRAGIAPPAMDAPGAPLLRIAGVVRRFGNVAAVDGVSLDIRAGEFFALLGPSGCGKTTLLRMLAGFETPDEGAILLDGVDIAHALPHQRPLNMMFQSYALFPHLTVAGNVAFGLKRMGLSKAETEARVGELLALVQLDGFAGRRPDQLSGGQRQRVALARALARRPRVLLLDEPLAALDKKLREGTQRELAALQRRLGMTFIVVTHDQEEAMALADRIGVMNAGRLAQVAPPRELYEAPASRWVAEFVGDVNIVEAEVTGRDGGRLTLWTDAACAITAAAPRQAPAGAVCVAVRPEKIRLAPRAADAVPAAPNTLPGEVVGHSYLGDISLYQVKLATGAVLRAAVTNIAREGAGFAVGAQVVASFAPDDCMVLPR